MDSSLTYWNGEQHKRSRWDWSMDWKMYFCLVKFEMPIINRYLNGGFENAVGYIRLELSRDLY